MREYLEQLLLVLAIGSAVAIVAKRISVPYNVALVVVGLLLVLMNVLPETPMDPGVVLLVFLPILIFQGALSADATSMRQAARPILALAVPGVAMSLLATAAIAAWEIGLPFPVALLLGAVLAITDTVSVLLAFRSVRVPHRLAAIMEGESLFNDGTALVLVSVAATVVMQGYADPPRSAGCCSSPSSPAALLGALFGTLGALVLRRAPDDLTAILASVVAVFATSLRHRALPRLAGDRRRRRRRADRPRDARRPRAVARPGAAGLLGDRRLRHQRLAVPAGRHAVAAPTCCCSEAWPIVLAVVALHAGRAVAVYGCFGALHLSGDGVPWRWQHVMVFGNVKGALSMAAVLALPAGHRLPRPADRHRLRRDAGHAGDAGAAVPRLPDLAGRRRQARDETADECRAVLIGARRAQTELDTLLAAGPDLAPRARRALGGVPARHHRRRDAAAPRRARTPTRTWRCPRCWRRGRRRSSTPPAAA